MKIFLFTIITLLIINISFAQTNYYVATTGSDANDGSQALPWATIEHAVISAANPTSEVIIINVADGIYDLSNNQIDINRAFANLTILGQSTINTIVQSAADTTLSTSRVFKIYAGNTVTLKNMTIRNGRANNDGDGYTHGGGIFNLAGNLTIESCLVTQNVSGSTGTGYGVGICNVRGTLIVSNSTISHNTGAVSTTLPCYGGGIASIDGSTIISNSTISFNMVPSAGGIAIISGEGNSLNTNFEIQNSTVSENRAYNSYGGIRISRWGPGNSKTITASFNSCTIFQNYADFSIGGVGFSSELITTGIEANIKNSIFAGNKSTNNIDLSFQSGVGIINSDGYNIIQKYNGEAISGQTNNGIDLDPNLLPLADNNTLNSTQTCAIPSNSPARDQIPALSPNGAPLLDQRGYKRVGDYDIGSYEYPTLRARVQLVHNSADILADTVDVYVNDSLAINNFAFRTATPFIDLPAGETLNIGFAPATSTSVNDTLKNFPVVLNSGEAYVVFANGVLDSSLYAQNPDGKSTEFTLFVKDMARETAAGSDVDLFVLQGITNLPAIEVRVRELGNAVLVDSLSYSDMTPYITTAAQDITLDIYSADGLTYLESFRAPLAGLGGQAVTVFASGFVDSSANQNGPDGGLYAALANGTVIKLNTGLSGDFYVGAPGTGPGGSDPQFATLRDAFEVLNNAAFTGDCNFYITSDILETFTPAVGYGLGLAINPEPYIVTFKPYTDVQPVVTLAYPTDGTSGPSGALIIGIPMDNNIAWNDLRITKNIIIDGSNSDGGTTRDLTIQSAATAQRNAFPLTIVGDVSNMVVKNTNIYYKAQGVSTSGNLFVSAVQLRSRSNSGVDFVPHNILFENNHISANFDGVVQSAQGYGTYQSGSPVPVAFPYNITLKNNLIEGKRRAVTLYKAGSHDLIGNEIVLNQNIAANTTNEAIYAVDVDTNSVVNIYDNKISKVSSATNAANNGNTAISIETMGTYNVYNNMIYGFELTAANPVAYVRGIKNNSASATLNLNFNSIYMTNLADIGTGAVTYQGILISNGTNELKNNIVVSDEPDFTSYCIYRDLALGTLTSDYNDYYPVSATNGNVGYSDTAAAKTLADWQTASLQDVNSLSVDPQLVSPLDLHFTNVNTPLLGKGILVPGITTDIDGELRDSIPEIGADEFPGLIPVELFSFSANVVDGRVQLTWKTATEVNNKGFEIQRRNKTEFETIGFVAGNGTTTESRSYSFADNNATGGKFTYRLKQLDYDGTSSYSNLVEVDLTAPLRFDLAQNYPNPFNPATTIVFQTAEPVNVTLSIYNMLGQEVTVLINNQFTNAGQHSVRFDASTLASGTYIYRITAGKFVQTKKMILLK